MVNVTQTFLPSIEEYQKYIEIAWNNKWITNRGTLLLELEDKLKTFLDAKHLTLTTNGTLPIQIAIKALELKGEIITTPFSYVATLSSIIWENCTPVFVDIDTEYLTIDETKIENAITSYTSGILATHVFGNPCNVIEIEKIANKHNLKVIYDAAHCFGVKYKGESIFNYGNVSTCSFHATKIFHTGEGGCWITQDKELQKKMFFHHNFGHDGQEKYFGLGINAKMSELQAAMGLAVFNHLEDIFEKRRKVVEYYNQFIDFKKIKKLQIRKDTSWNYHYYPIIFENEDDLLIAKKRMNQENIFPRRYFYPSLNTLPYVDYKQCEISEEISRKILCLPLYHELEQKWQDIIIDIL